MYGAIDSNDQYELKIIQTQCWLCGLSIEVRRGIPAYCSACLQDNPKFGLSLYFVTKNKETKEIKSIGTN